MFVFCSKECWSKCSLMTITHVTVSPELLASWPMYFFAHIGLTFSFSLLKETSELPKRVVTYWVRSTGLVSGNRCDSTLDFSGCDLRRGNSRITIFCFLFFLICATRWHALKGGGVLISAVSRKHDEWRRTGQGVH